jgi:DNA polymerase-3 subunit gamma/tau
MTLALYRRYRPQRFADVLGQARVVDTLQEALRRGMVRHAYVFSGPRGTGKTSVARLLARAVNCENFSKGKLSEGEPCNTCPACVRAQQGSELDLIEIDAASNRGIDEIRELRERVRFAPSGGKKKVFLIDEFHMLTKEAFNALLKTLEEPPAHAIFILATTEAHSIPATIMSRAQHFTFSNLNTQTLIEHLGRVARKEKVTSEPEALQLIAQYAEGGARDALSLLDVAMSAAGARKISVSLVQQVLAIPDITRLERYSQAVARADTRAALTELTDAARDGLEAFRVAQFLVRYWRTLALMHVDQKLAAPTAPLATAKQMTALQELAKAMPRKQLVRGMLLFNQAAVDARHGAVPWVPLEAATLTLIEENSSPATLSNVATINTVQIDQPVVAAAPHSVRKPFKPVAKKSTLTAKISTQVTSDNLEADSGMLSQLLARWNDALRAVRDQNLSVGELLRSAVVLKVVGSTAICVVAYRFHKERLTSTRNRHMVESTLEQLYGKKLRIDARVPEELTDDEQKLYQQAKAARSATTASAESAPLAQVALDLLGGQVVE